MQRTRINTLFEEAFVRFSRFFQNPWRRTALILILFLFGNALGTVIPTTAGQAAIWDPVVGVVLLVITELVSRIHYRQPQRLVVNPNDPAQNSNNVFFFLLNILKIGFVYGMFVEAFKIGS
ncbi:DUF565 domain-containing protein [Picosynechococcus sp. NKBG15041c]|uniref:DUF565 domain-containing protein n=1 Tax=Picosynechococcus sp. NKBG15041c TaxID=1407650 RepID=UPI0004129432|nr:DUF565 domain-containing protein [Picosynechococcus sp. NKBG15041c]